jgi:uncharacterized repeat protein (TIGR01451 family)
MLYSLRSRAGFFLIAAYFLGSIHALANVNVTAASGGTGISADKAANAASPAWTSLGPITIAEMNKADITAGTSRTLVLKAPVGFEFNTSPVPNVAFTAGQDISAASIAVSDSTTLTITLTAGGTANFDTLTIGNTTAIQVRPTLGSPLAGAGQIFRPTSGGGSATIAGITTSANANGSGGTSFGSLSEVAGTASNLLFTTQPAAANTGAIFGTQPVVKSQDQFGNNSSSGLPASLTVTAALTAGTGPLLGTASLNIGTSAGNGTVSYANLQIDVPGNNKQLTATASGLAAGLSAVFSVNGRPTISAITNRVTPEDIPTAPIPFTITDAETDPDSLSLVASSSNTNLVPITNIVFGGTGTDRTLVITPATNQFGSATISITVSDGAASATNSFLLTVTSVNDPPTLTALTNRTILEEAVLQTVNLSGITFGPTNESPQIIAITATSSNLSLIPNPTVNYTSPNATGTLTFTPVAGQFGSALITVVVKDNGGITNGGVDSLTNTFLVTVQPVNDPPTLNALTNRTILEDAALQTVDLAGITPGPANENDQVLTVTATSGNPTLIPNPTVNYTSPSANGTITFAPLTNQFGSALITVIVRDDGGTANGGNDSVTNTFTVTVTNVNDPPTLTALTNRTILEDAGLQTVNLSGITAGPTNESAQIITITATSGNLGLIPNPTVTYTSPNPTGTLTFTPVSGQSGSALITVIVKDNGGTTNSGVDSLTNTFTVTVQSVNDSPTLNTLTNLTILEEAPTQTVNLSGISAGPVNENGQVLTVTATSDNPTLIPNPTVNYSSPAATGTISFAPLTNQFGSALISVTVSDDGGTSNGGIDSVTRTFTVTVTNVNDPPTLNAPTNFTIIEDAGFQTVNLNGISAGPTNENTQTITITATSGNTSLIPNPTVNYTSPNPTGALTFTPATGLSGTALITVVVKDNGGTNNSGRDSLTNTFTVTVQSANDPPTLNSLTDRTILEDAATQTVNLSGISPGPANESGQVLTVTATSDNPTLIPNPIVNYTSPAATGTINFAPLTNLFGSALITVIVRDDGGTNNGGSDSVTNTFTVTVTAVNDPPSLDPIGNVILDVNPGLQTVNLSGIGFGPANEGPQTITLTATSSVPSIIPNPTVSYTSPSATGSLSFTPVTNSAGTATISVLAKDNGGPANGGQDSLIRQFTVTVNPLSDLAITQVATPNPGFLGGTISFILTISNGGPTTASGILVTNTLPAGIGSAVATATQGTCTNLGGIIICDLGALANGSVARVTNIVEPLSLGAYTNNASVTGSVLDPNLANNSSTSIATVVAGNFSITGFSLATEHCVNGGIDPAEPVTVNFSIKNNGTANTTNLVATLRAIGGVTVPGAPQNYGVLVAGGASVSRPFTFTPIGVCGGTFTASFQLQDGPTSLGGVSTTITLGTVATNTTVFSNTASIPIPSTGIATPYPSIVTVSGLQGPIQKVRVTFNNLSHSQPDDLDILLVGPGGERVMLMSDVGGIDDINNVSLTFDDSAASALPDNSQIASGTYKPTDFQTSDSLPGAPGRPYSSVLSVFNGTVPNGVWQLFINDDTASFSGNMAGGWTLAIDSIEPSCCIDTGSANLTLGSQSSPNPVVVGNAATNTITVANLGPATATGVIVTNPLPPGATFLSAIASQGTCTNIGSAYVCNLGTLTNTASASVQIALLPGLTGVLTNIANVVATQPDSNPSNNFASSTVNVVVPSVLLLADVIVTEGNSGTTNAIFTVLLDSPSSQTITVNYATSNDTATAGADYVGTSGILTFVPGQTTNAIVVPVNGDIINEATEFFTVNLFNPTNVTIANGIASCAILNDDALPSISIADVTVTEGNSGFATANFVVTLSPASGQQATVNFATANGSALAGSDYLATNGTVIFDPGQTTQTISVQIIGDTINESNETFFVNLNSPVNANVNDGQAVGTISNDDTLATIGAAGATLAIEGCVPANSAIDPTELVTVNFSLRNISAGTASTTNLVATLLPIGGITLPGNPQTYGVLAPGGSAVNRSFSFTANGICGDTLIAVLQLQDGGNSLGRVTNFLAIGNPTTVTNSFSNSNVVTIQDNSPASPYPSIINVSGLGTSITRVTASLFGLSHTFPADMDILLVGPAGQKVILMSDAGGGNSLANVSINFADSAAVAIPFSDAITNGTYKPADWTDAGTADSFAAPAPSGPYGTNLSVFNGINPNGPWSLYIVDDTGGDVGSLAGGWSLTLTTVGGATCCGPNSSADLVAVMTSSQPSVPLGSNITFTINVTNLGPNIASDAVLTNPLPAGLVFQSATNSIGILTNDNGTIVWNLGLMTNTARANMTLTVAATLPGTVTNIAVASSRSADPNLANSTASAAVAVVPPTPIALFTASPLIGPVPLPVTFFDNSAGNITNRFWTFGDGSTTNTALTNFIHAYNSAGTYTVSLAVQGSGGTNLLTRTNYIVATNVPPILTINPGSLNFGVGVSGQTSTQSFQVINTGGLTLSGSATSSLPFQVQSGSPFTVAPGQTGLVSITFAPPSSGTFSNVVLFTSNGGGSTNTVAGSATNPPPKFVVTPVGLDFGGVIIGQTVFKSFELVNTGAVTLSGTASTSLPFDVPSPAFVLAPGETGLVSVAFSPVVAGNFSNVVVFDSSGGSSTNTVTGSGLTPPQLAILPGSLNFGTVAVGSNVQASFTVTNIGGAALSNGLASIDGGPFTILSGTPFNLPGFGSTNLVVRFAPSSAVNFSNVVLFTTSNAGSSTNSLLGTGALVPTAAFSGSPTNGVKPLTVTFTDSSTGTITNRFWNFGDGSTTNTSVTTFSHTYTNGSTNTVTLTVTGPVGTNTLVRANYIAATNLPPHLSINPSSLAFGPVIIGQTNTQTFQVINNGDLTLTGTATSTVPFGVSSGSPFTVLARATNLISISFTPVSAGNFSNVVTFASNGGNSTNTVTGSGLTPGQLVVSPGSINFGTVAVGSNVQASFTVTNTGGATLSNGVATINSGPFTILSGTPFNLAGFSSTNLVVRFAPSSAVNFSNVVIFTTSNGGNSTNPVLGTGALVPAAAFTGSPTNGVKPLTVTFTDSSTGTITNRFWNFGDGSTTNTSATTFSHTYTNGSTNTVTLTVTGPVGTNTLVRANYIASTNLPPQLSLSPASLAFGPIIVGQTNTQTFQIINTGDLTLTGTATSTVPFRVSSGSPFTVLARQTNLISISFTPVSAGNFSNVVTFTSNGGNSTNTVTGSGLTPAQLAVVPGKLDFGIVPVGSAPQAAFTVTNLGGATLSNCTVSIDTGPFTILSALTFNLPGFSSSNLVVSFAPDNAGSFSNNIVVVSDNAGGSTNQVTGIGALVPAAEFTGSPTNGAKPLTVTFTDSSIGTITNRFWDFGDGKTTNTAALIVSHTYTEVSTNTVQLQVSGPVGSSVMLRTNYIVATNPPPQLVITPTNNDFGQVTIGQIKLQSFVVVNIGSQQITGSISSTLPFGLPDTSFTVPAGQTGFVDVTFAPDAPGSFSNIVVFTSNGGNFTNGVTGIGLTPAQLATSPASIDFGTVAVGSNAQASFTVTNLGESPLLNGIVSLSSGPFANLSPSIFSLPALGSTEVIVQFAPASSGSFSNVVLFLSAFGNTTNTLTGIGAAVPIADFNANPTGGVNPLTVTFSDTSTGTITNRFWDFGDGSTTNTSATTFSHTYTNVSTNTVSLTVTGPVGTNTLVRADYITSTNLPPQLSVNPSSLVFVPAIIGQTNTQTFQIVNTGDLTLTGTASSTFPFGVENGSPFTVLAHQTNLVSISFAPDSAGSFSNVVTFASNGGNSTNTVTGTGLAPAQLAVLPGSLNFGTVAVGSELQASLTVTNIGGATLSNGVASMDGGPFIIVSGTPFSLPGFGSTNLVIAFTPPSTGNFSNVVLFTTGNGGGSTNSVLGVGALVPTAEFTGTPTSGQVPLTVTFTDTSTGFLTNRFWNFGDGTSTNTTGLLISHVYTTPGTNTVTLTASGPLGVSTRTRPNYVIVRAAIKITSLRFEGTDVLVAFETAPGRNYRLEYNDALAPAEWATSVDNIPGTGEIVEVSDPNPRVQHRFYRVRQLP